LPWIAHYSLANEIKKMSDVVELTDDEFWALLDQARDGETETVLAAVKRDPRLANRATGDGDRLLYCACIRGHLELARGLLVLGAQINARDSDGWDALMAASESGHLAVVGWLLSKGADPNSRNADCTALSLAAEFDHLDICLLLVSHAADLLEIDRQTALDLYGSGLDPKLYRKVKKQRLALLREAYDEGPHPNARWVRRWPFVCVLVGCEFQPLLARQLVLLELNPPLPPDAKIPPIEIATPEQYRAYLHGLVFAHEGIWKLIASYL
jgi:Ankyrin repeats (3 copies)